MGLIELQCTHKIRIQCAYHVYSESILANINIKNLQLCAWIAQNVRTMCTQNRSQLLTSITWNFESNILQSAHNVHTMSTQESIPIVSINCEAGLQCAVVRKMWRKKVVTIGNQLDLNLLLKILTVCSGSFGFAVTMTSTGEGSLQST